MAKFCLAAMLLLSISATAQIVPFDSDRWEIQAKEHKIIEHLGRKTLYLKGGFALIKDAPFTDGIIEFDIAFTDEQGFMGAVWRLQDTRNYEDFYLPPPHSSHGDANQYQPVFNGVEAWQLYSGEGYGAATKYEFNQWTHVKIVVVGKQAEVYIKDMETPALFVNELKHEIKPGKVGLRVSNFGPGYYSNFSFVAQSRLPLKGKPKAAERATPGTVMSWLVSNAVAGKSLNDKYQLQTADKQSLSWKRLDSEPTGIANLARLQGTEPERDTVFARLVIQSDREQVKKLRFGFSDAVKVYCNDRLISGGSNVFRSRDEHFMGTIGLHDEVYLPLKKGANELWLAVTENFGGWGVKALFEDMTGISFKEVQP
ncbi:MAG TPA: hypothetical protein PLQ88_02455 [Blastocatellia bacterium]|nr:hypothetical protein [Blastocatellia bacterium]